MFPEELDWPINIKKKIIEIMGDGSASKLAEDICIFYRLKEMDQP
jgi:hypothetical protein